VSDIDEMVKEYRRALELRDFVAAISILGSIETEARSLGMGELADKLIDPLAAGDYISASPIIREMARKAVSIDLAAHQIFGPGFNHGIEMLDMAVEAAGIK
jgi:hypothetical protein